MEHTRALKDPKEDARARDAQAHVTASQLDRGAEWSSTLPLPLQYGSREQAGAGPMPQRKESGSSGPL